ncbi:DNA-3-methyladenine glycosylase [Naumannella huperziae]
MRRERLERQLAGSAPEVAPRLLGSVLRHGEVAVRITEVEAYAGADDPASHAWRGETARNATMFGPAGHLYVYTMHGHSCCNVVCGAAGTPTGLLVRAGEVIGGIDAARARRGERTAAPVPDARLARGPGNLTRCLGITRAYDGADLAAGEGPALELADPLPPELITAGPRVGVSRATDVPWRFFIAGDPTVSAYRPARLTDRTPGTGRAPRRTE